MSPLEAAGFKAGLTQDPRFIRAVVQALRDPQLVRAWLYTTCQGISWLPSLGPDDSTADTFEASKGNYLLNGIPVSGLWYLNGFGPMPEGMLSLYAFLHALSRAQTFDALAPTLTALNLPAEFYSGLL